MIGEFFAAAAAAADLIVGLRGDVTDCGKQIGLVQVGTVVVLQRELKARAEMPAAARALADDAGRHLFLQTDARQLVSVAAHAILTGVFVNLVGIFAVYGDGEAGAGSFEIVVGLGPGSSAKLLLIVPLGNLILIDDGSAAEIIAGGLLARARLVRGRIIREDEDMFAVLVFEVVIDAFFFHQSRDEVEICFPVLHAIVPGSETAVKA